MRAIILVPNPVDHPYFSKEARGFLDCHKLGPESLIAIDTRQHAQAQREAVISAIQGAGRGDLACVAFCCHGRRRGIQLGFRLDHLDQLAGAIAQAAAPSVAVPLFCCSTGADTEGTAGDGDFADLLRDELCFAGAVNCTVDGHLHSGHCTSHPFVRRFEGKGSTTGGVGGRMIVDQDSALWPGWKTLLGGRDKGGSTLRFRYPLMSIEDIHQEIFG